MDREELTAQIEWLAKHGFIEVIGISDDGEWYYAPTEKGKNATVEQMNELLQQEIDGFLGETDLDD